MPYRDNKPAFASILEGVANGLQSGIQKGEDAKKEEVQRDKDQLSYYSALRQAGYTMEEASSRVNTTYGGQQHQGFLEKVFSQGGKKKDVFSPPSFDAYGEGQLMDVYDQSTGQVIGKVKKNTKFINSQAPMYDSTGKYIGMVPANAKILRGGGKQSLQDILAGEDDQGAAPSTDNDVVTIQAPDKSTAVIKKSAAQKYLSKPGYQLVQ